MRVQTGFYWWWSGMKAVGKEQSERKMRCPSSFLFFIFFIFLTKEKNAQRQWGKKIGQRGRKCIFSSGSLPTLQLCSERNRRLHEEMCADITVQYIIAIPCRPLKTTLDCLSLINVVPARKKSKSIRACKKTKQNKKLAFIAALL